MTTAPRSILSPTPEPLRLAPRCSLGTTLATRLGRRLIAAALSRLELGQVSVVDGDWACSSRARGHGPAATVFVHNPRFYSAIALRGSMGVAEAYMDGLWDTDDLPGLIETLAANRDALLGLDGVLSRLVGPSQRIRAWLDRNTRAGSRRNIRAHYDLGNDFFELFLDPTLTYSSAVFENGAQTLHEAQIEKIDRACRKLDLRPGDHLLEIGTGWGALAMHAAANYGCRVTTTTISQRQFDHATARIREAGLQDRIEVLFKDYRDLTGQYDKLVSIEMIEAVGREHLDTFFSSCSRLLRPHGAMLLQAIVIGDRFFESAARRVDFLKRYIFPGSCLPSVAAILGSTRRKTDLGLWHLEDIGPHYATTLAMWRRSFLQQVDRVSAMGFDRRFIRMWDYYLAYCEGAFRARHVGTVQALFTKPQCRMAPACAAAAGGRA